MKRIIINILAVVFVSCCHYWTYRAAYIEGYKQAIKDEIEYIESQMKLKDKIWHTIRELTYS